ncbi:hypothetical protein ACMTAS_1905 [Thermotoga neapolitana DSM 4359]
MKKGSGETPLPGRVHQVVILPCFVLVLVFFFLPFFDFS